jgi:hypothetical protein
MNLPAKRFWRTPRLELYYMLANPLRTKQGFIEES